MSQQKKKQYEITPLTSPIQIQTWYGETTGKISEKEKELEELYKTRKDLVEIYPTLSPLYSSAVSPLERKFWGLLQADRARKEKETKEAKGSKEEKEESEEKGKEKKKKKKTKAKAQKKKKVEKRKEAPSSSKNLSLKERISKKLKVDAQRGPPVPGIKQIPVQK